MRYYLIKIFYNKVAQAEDRPQPQAFSTKNAALKAYHQYLGQSIESETCGWVLTLIINEFGNIEEMTRWDAPILAPTE